jgi:hypothetical protein
MNIISEQKSAELVSTYIKQYPEATCMPFLKCWNKLKLVFHIVALSLSVLLSIITTQYYRDVILSLTETVQCGGLIVFTMGFIIIVTTVLLYVCIHEFIHFFGFKLCHSKCIFVYSKPLTVSVMGLSWLKKTQVLLITILPFFVVNIIVIFVYFITNNHLLFTWLVFINISLSCTDFICFFILLKIPKNSLVFGHYYRRQQ